MTTKENTTEPTTRLGAWLKTQYGPGRVFPSGRQLSLAVSEGNNPNLVFDIERRGNAKVPTLVKLADTLGVPAIRIFSLLGAVPETEAEDEGMSADERQVLAQWRRLPPDDQAAIGVIMAGLLRSTDAAA